MAAPLTEAAIAKIRDLIVEGVFRPGDRLPPELQLSEQLGLSRSSTREAVRALVTSRVLDVRRGDGTYVTSLSPELLLEGIGFAIELTQEDSLTELVEARRVLEPQVTALAARRVDAAALQDIERHLDAMSNATDPEELVKHDAAFHATVARSSGNGTLSAMLTGISSVTVRARVWRGFVNTDANQRAILEHRDILDALKRADPVLAEARALVHVASIEEWLRGVLASTDGGAGDTGAGEANAITDPEGAMP
jgi:GntR family transcriptional regulator, transcriptional repressor for pyruvate dehydrogenase complex